MHIGRVKPFREPPIRIRQEPVRLCARALRSQYPALKELPQRYILCRPVRCTERYECRRLLAGRMRLVAVLMDHHRSGQGERQTERIGQLLRQAEGVV